MSTAAVKIGRDILNLEKKLIETPRLMSAEALADYAAESATHPLFETFSKVKNFSMLHVDVLLLLRLCALASSGGILEIGPYIGGSTVAIASGVRDGSAPKFISVEPGGDYVHPEYPSNDILADLRRNLRKYGLTKYVQIVEGMSHNQNICEQVKKALSKFGVSMFFIDADGEIGRDMDLYRSLLHPDCFVILDDYIAPGNAGKELRVRAIVDEEVAAGRLETFGVFGWGTWFGRYLGA